MALEVAAIALFVVAEDPYARGHITAAFDDSDDIAVVGESAEPDPEDLGLRRDLDLVVFDLGGDPDSTFPDDPLWHEIPFLALAGDVDAARGALAAGAGGVVSRESETGRIVAAVRAIHAGLKVVDTDFDEVLVREPQVEPEPQIPVANLTAREHEVLELLSRGLSNPEIAEELGVTRHTAKFHVKAILDKLGAQTRTEAVVLAARNGLLHL